MRLSKPCLFPLLSLLFPAARAASVGTIGVSLSLVPLRLRPRGLLPSAPLCPSTSPNSFSTAPSPLVAPPSSGTRHWLLLFSPPPLMALGLARHGSGASWPAHLPCLTCHRDRSVDLLCAATSVPWKDRKRTTGPFSTVVGTRWTYCFSHSNFAVLCYCIYINTLKKKIYIYIINFVRKTYARQYSDVVLCWHVVNVRGM